MQSLKHISILQPCSQNWNNMTEATSGRHCELCAKTVVDFTAMTNQQIIDYLSYMQHNKTCGRFSDSQFNSLNYQLSTKATHTTYWKQIILAATLFYTTIYAKAQTGLIKPKIEQTPTSILLGKVINTDTTKYRIVTGMITDANDKLPLPGVSIKADGLNIGTTTKTGGAFVFKIPITVKTISVTYIGYTAQSIKIDDSPFQQTSVALKMVPALLGEVVVVRRQSFVKRMYYKLIKRPIRKIFG